MAQLNIHMTPQFAEQLRRFMALRGLKTKAEALRTAVAEGIERSCRGTRSRDFKALVGAATRVPLNPRPRFKDHDDLW